jgi:hypothetical protein
MTERDEVLDAHYLTDHGTYIQCACGQQFDTPYAANLHAAEWDHLEGIEP